MCFANTTCSWTARVDLEYKSLSLTACFDVVRVRTSDTEKVVHRLSAAAGHQAARVEANSNRTVPDLHLRSIAAVAEWGKQREMWGNAI
jgi:hypothetical protein